MAAGLSVIPVKADGTKAPAWQLLPQAWNDVERRLKHSWKPFLERRPTSAEINAWYSDLGWATFYGIAVVGGAVSGGLEIIDLDTIDLVEPWARYVEERIPGLLDRLVFVETPRPGMHAYFRSVAGGGSQKLARTVIDDPSTGRKKNKTLIELKGEGGYCLVPPSPLGCHPSRRPYVFVNEKDLSQVPTVTVSERAVLLDAAKALDRPLRPALKLARRPKRRRLVNCSRPGDQFNAYATWAEILEPHGWTLVGVDAGGEEHWCRPGKNQGQSATANYAGRDLLHVFSENAEPFEAGRSYTKFSAFAILNHRGDFKRAAESLHRKTIGSARSYGRALHRRGSIRGFLGRMSL
ncbi:MAG TPA: bifunctional DNA primase/polymerase [Pirellulales bacterium]